MSKKVTKSKSKEQEVSIKRKFKGEEEIYHDLFCLEETETIKDVGWNPQRPLIEKFNHKHFYHTVDSDGKKQTHCTPSLGHTHEVKVVGTEEDGSPKIEIGPAVVVMKKKMGGKQSLPYKFDNHTHESRYMYSEKLSVRKYSDEALASISKVKQQDTELLRAPTE